MKRDLIAYKVISKSSFYLWLEYKVEHIWCITLHLMWYLYKVNTMKLRILWIRLGFFTRLMIKTKFSDVYLCLWWYQNILDTTCQPWWFTSALYLQKSNYHILRTLICLPEHMLLKCKYLQNQLTTLPLFQEKRQCFFTSARGSKFSSCKSTSE